MFFFLQGLESLPKAEQFFQEWSTCCLTYSNISKNPGPHYSIEHLELDMLGFGCLLLKATIACAVVGNSVLEAEALIYMNSMLMENYFQFVTDFSTEIRWFSCQIWVQRYSSRMTFEELQSFL